MNTTAPLAPQNAGPVRLPPPVEPGDRVGVAALSGPVDPDRLARGLGALREMGFEPVLGRNLERPKHLIFAGDDEERLAAFHELAADPSLRALWFARGGSGLLRILPRIDWPLLERFPRAYLGYSDLTPFLDEVVRRLGLAAFHAPMVAADLARGLDSEERNSLLEALAGRLPARMPLEGWLRTGEASGRLVGGCLSMLVSTLGTAHAPLLDGAILVLEDVNEPAYRLDRMLTQLALAGAFDRLAGLVLGHFDPPGGRGEEAGEAQQLWHRLCLEVTADFAWPIALGLPCGHSPPNLTLPLGLHGKLDPIDACLNVDVASP